MKFKVTMKDPDTLYDAIDEAVSKELNESNLAENEKDAIKVLRSEKYSDIASEWFYMSEYLTVEIDTDNKTIRIVPVGED